MEKFSVEKQQENKRNFFRLIPLLGKIPRVNKFDEFETFYGKKENINSVVFLEVCM